MLMYLAFQNETIHKIFMQIFKFNYKKYNLNTVFLNELI